LFFPDGLVARLTLDIEERKSMTPRKLLVLLSAISYTPALELVKKQDFYPGLQPFLL
jgi:hypothetical protein